MTLEQEFISIKCRLDEISRSLKLKNQENSDHEYFQLTNELCGITEKIIERIQNHDEPSTKTNPDKIKEKNTTDHSLQNEANILHTIMENTHAQLAFLDRDLNFVLVNEAYVKGCGFSREALIGKNHFQLFPNDENEKIFQKVVETRKPVYFHARPFENQELPETGTTYWDWSLVPTLDKEGTVNGLVFSLLNVTEFELVKRQLEEEQDRLNIILESIPTGTMIIDENKERITINKAGQEIINHFAKIKVDSNYYSFNSEMGARILEVSKPLTQTIKEGSSLSIKKMAFKDSDQNERTLSIYTAPLINRQSTISGSVSAFQDVTETLSLERRLNERNFDLLMLNRLGRDLSRSLDLQEVINNTLTAIQELIDCSGSSVWIVNDKDVDQLECVGAYNSGKISPVNQKISIEESLLGWVAKHGKSALVNDVFKDDRFSFYFSKLIDFPIHSLIAVPLQWLDRNIGVLEVFNETTNSFNQHDQILLEMLANNAVVAINNATFYLHAQEAAAAEERAHLARELHDAVSQTLFSTSIIAESLPRLWDKNPERVRYGLDQLHLLTKSALAEMRTLLLELRPQFLSETNLNELLLQLLDSFQNRSNLQINYKNNCDPDLPKKVQVVFYRIAQEALQNVVKHAHANIVDIYLDYDPMRTILTIEDNGRGYDPEQKIAGHMGVEIMRERANNAKINLSIESLIGKGTKITATWNNLDGEVGNG